MISSSDNPQIKLVKSLQSRRSARRKNNLFVIEGPNLIEEAVKNAIALDRLYYTESFSTDDEKARILQAATAQGVSAIEVTEALMSEMSDTQSPQGILAVVPDFSLPQPADPTFVLVLDGISDPGNLGTILRSAAAADVDLVITTAGTVDMYNPKVLRAAAGAHFRLPIFQFSWEAIPDRFESHVILLADSGSGAPYFQVDWTQPVVLIVSEEAHGPSEGARRIAHARVTIPMPGGMESLNVSVASAILFFEVVRQRS